MDFAKMVQESTAKKEYNDCAVKAVALATGIDYNQAHQLLAKHGRRFRGRTKRATTMNALAELGYKTEQVNLHYRGTVRTIVNRLPRVGTFLIATRGHILCVKDRVVEDWTAGKLHRVVEVMRVVKIDGPAIREEIIPTAVPNPQTVRPTQMPKKPSSKFTIYCLWSGDPEHVKQHAETLATELNVKAGTIRGWIGEWSRGKNFPTR